MVACGDAFTCLHRIALSGAIVSRHSSLLIIVALLFASVLCRWFECRVDYWIFAKLASIFLFDLCCRLWGDVRVQVALVFEDRYESPPRAAASSRRGSPILLDRAVRLLTRTIGLLCLAILLKSKHLACPVVSEPGYVVLMTVIAGAPQIFLLVRSCPICICLVDLNVDLVDSYGDIAWFLRTRERVIGVDIRIQVLHRLSIVDKLIRRLNKIIFISVV